MGLGPTGWLEGNTDQITFACDFIVDFNDFMIYMQGFRLVSLGSISIIMRGNPLIDWLSNLIVNTVINPEIQTAQVEIFFVLGQMSHLKNITLQLF